MLKPELNGLGRATSAADIEHDSSPDAPNLHPSIRSLIFVAALAQIPPLSRPFGVIRPSVVFGSSCATPAPDPVSVVQPLVPPTAAQRPPGIDPLEWVVKDASRMRQRIGRVCAVKSVVASPIPPVEYSITWSRSGLPSGQACAGGVTVNS